MADSVLTYPEKFHLATSFADKRYGDLESNTELETGAKLALYALRQQAEVGPCNRPAPYMWNVTEKYKHSAWSHLGKMNKFEAMVKYVQILEKLVGEDWHMSPAMSPVKGEKRSGPEEAYASTNNIIETTNTTDVLPTELTAENFAKLREEVSRLRLEVAALKRRNSTSGEGNVVGSRPLVIPSATPPPPPIFIHYGNSTSNIGMTASSSSPVMLAPLPIPPPAVPPASRYHADQQLLRAQQRSQQKQLGISGVAPMPPAGSAVQLHHQPPTVQTNPLHSKSANNPHSRGVSAVVTAPVGERQRTWMEWLGLS